MTQVNGVPEVSKESANRTVHPFLAIKDFDGNITCNWFSRISELRNEA